MLKWLHHLLNPHCPDCRLELEASKICGSCEMLTMELAHLRNENSRLLDRIINPPTEVKSPAVDRSNFASLSSSLPWRVRREMLEREDRESLKLRNKQAAQGSQTGPLTVEQIEKELGVSDAAE